MSKRTFSKNIPENLILTSQLISWQGDCLLACFLLLNISQSPNIPQLILNISQLILNSSKINLNIPQLILNISQSNLNISQLISGQGDLHLTISLS